MPKKYKTQKSGHIKEILRNSCYKEESIPYQNLVKALNRLSASDVGNLKLLNDIQRQDSLRKGMLK